MTNLQTLTFIPNTEISEMSTFQVVEFLLDNTSKFPEVDGKPAILKAKGISEGSTFDVYLTVDSKNSRIILESTNQYMIVRKSAGTFLVSHETEGKMFRQTSNSLYSLFSMLKDAHDNALVEIHKDITKVASLIMKKVQS